MTYFEETTQDNAVDEETEEIQKIVGNIKHSRETEDRYMTLQEIIDHEMFHRIKSYLRIITISMVLSIGFVWLVCFFNECSLSQAFKVQETKVFAWIAICGNLFLILTCALVVIMNLLPIPKLPGGPWEKEQLIVCRYSELTYSALTFLCEVLGFGMLYGAYLNAIEPAEYEAWVPVLVLGTFGPVFIALGGVFFMFMKNYMLIFYPDGVFYQNLLGKTYVATNEQIEYVSIIPAYQQRSFRLHTADRDLWINWYCSRYHEAEQYALNRFIDFATYRERRQESDKRF